MVKLRIENEFDKIMRGESDYQYADKVKKLYDFLDNLGNVPEWQLKVLGILVEGIQDKIDYENKMLRLTTKNK